MVMDICQSVAFKRLFTCLLVLPVVALWCVPTASAQPVGENGRKLDFVYSPCVFDSCYTLFMRIARPLNSDTSLHAQLFMTRSTAPTRGVSGVFNSRQIQAYGRAKKVRKMYEEIHSNPAYDEAEEKQRLVQQLCSFSDTAHALPIVYAVIANDYGGDVEAYVDALFRRSALTNKRRMKRLTRSPSVRKMQRDMGFQFVVARLMYRLWEARGCPAADAKQLVILRSELPKK